MITAIKHAAPSAKQRLLSLDALRGFDMFWIVCGEGIFHGFANIVLQKHGLVRDTTDWTIAANANLNFMERVVVGISNQLHHSVWNGCNFYDIIFPLFIFIAGVSMPYAYAKKINEENINKAIQKKKVYTALLKRTVILIVLGMVVNGLLQWKGYGNTRFASVLGRIGLSCFFATIIFLNCNLKWQLVWFAGILLGYWAVMQFIPVPNYGAGNLTPDGNLAAYIDQHLLPGKLHRKVYDPEGLLSTIPAICSAMLGVFAGTFLRWQSNSFTMFKKAIAIAVAGAACIIMGLLWDKVFPINKNLWTSSFVLYAGGWSLLLLSFFYLTVDVAGLSKWLLPLIWMGANSILIYLAAHGLINFEATAQFVFGGLINLTNAIWHPPLLWIGVALIQFALLYFLYTKKWFLKI